jgi:hypothetical protein
MPKEALNNLHPSPNIVKVIKSNWINRMGRLERVGGMRKGNGKVLPALK